MIKPESCILESLKHLRYCQRLGIRDKKKKEEEGIVTRNIVDTYETGIHFSLFVTGTEHLIVKFQDNVFVFVPIEASPIVDYWHVDLLQKIRSSFTYSVSVYITIRISFIFHQTSLFPAWFGLYKFSLE